LGVILYIFTCYRRNP